MTSSHTVRLALFAACLMAVCGCSTTVTPARVESRAASFDGNVQNSGVVESNPLGYVVTEHFRERYNLLIALYGREFQPRLQPDAGMREWGQNYLIDRQYMANFLTMNAWRRAGIAPSNL